MNKTKKYKTIQVDPATYHRLHMLKNQKMKQTGKFASISKVIDSALDDQQTYVDACTDEF